MHNRWKAYINGNVLTMDPAGTTATAFMTWAGRFVRVGNDDEIKAFINATMDVVDLRGRTVLPGFIEPHNHFSAYAMNLMRVDCSVGANRSIAELKDRIRARAVAAAPGEWIQGYGYDDSLIEDKRHLTREDLDEAAPDNPVQILHISVHFSYVNSRALEIAGIGAGTPSPANGQIHKDALGRPTGLLIEPGAMEMVMGHVPLFSTDQVKTAMLQAAGDLHRVGITGIHDGGIGYFKHGRQVVEAYGALEREGRLPFRVYMTLIETLFGDLFAKGIRTGFGSDMLRVGSVKSWQDGSIQGYTGALGQPYHSRPDFCGDLLIDQQVLDQMVAKYHSAGCQVALHANGDRAIESVLQAFENAYRLCPQNDRRHMIIHCQTASDDQIRRMKAIGVIPNYFVNHIYYWGDRHRSIFLGPERAARMDPLKTTLDQGLDFVLHSDMPVTPPDPIFSIHTAVNRITRQGAVLGADQRIPVYEALKTYTRNAVKCSFEEDRKGSIETGKLADFIVLSENPMAVAPENLKSIAVEETVLAGKSVYRHDA